MRVEIVAELDERVVLRRDEAIELRVEVDDRSRIVDRVAHHDG
jgi:hypothetical protein